MLYDHLPPGRGPILGHTITLSPLADCSRGIALKQHPSQEALPCCFAPPYAKGRTVGLPQGALPGGSSQIAELQQVVLLSDVQIRELQQQNEELNTAMDRLLLRLRRLEQVPVACGRRGGNNYAGI